MIGHYLSSNNEICYITRTNNFSPTKQTCQARKKLEIFGAIKSMSRAAQKGHLFVIHAVEDNNIPKQNKNISSKINKNRMFFYIVLKHFFVLEYYYLRWIYAMIWHLVEVG
jgi:hypothetical protein